MWRRLKHVSHSFAMAQTPGEVLATLDGVVALTGVRAFSVWRPNSFTDPQDRAAMSETMLFRDAAPETRKALKEGFMRRGPSMMARYAADSREPFTFCELKRRLQPTGDDRWIWDTYRDHDVRDGFYCGYWPWILVYVSNQVLSPDLLTEEARLTLYAGGAMAIGRMTAIERRDKSSPSRRSKLSEDCGLTPREIAVLSHLSHGFKVPQIADRMGLSVSTVQTFVARAARKLGACSQVHVVAEAVRRRLV